MPNPKRRHSKSRTRQRRAHDALKTPKFIVDAETAEARQPHRVDPKTGIYKSHKAMHQVFEPRAE